VSEDKEIGGQLKAIQRAKAAGGGKTGYFVALSQDKELPPDERKYYLRRVTEKEINRWDTQTYFKAIFGILGWALFEITLILYLLHP
jgi:hypothetical protein